MILLSKIEEYRNWLITNKSKNTVKNYVPYVVKFLEAVQLEDLNDLSQTKVTEFFSQEKDKFGGDRYNSLIKAVKGFCKFHKLDTLEFPKIKEIVSAKIKTPITERELGKIIEPNLYKLFPDPLSVKALLYFMFYTGFRKNEIIALKRSAFNFTKNPAQVTAYATKQSIQRRLPINPNLSIVLQKYFRATAEETNAFNMTVDKLKEITDILQVNEILGANRKVWAHLFRDSFACHSLNNGVQLPNLQKLMGHKTVKQTMKYLTLSEDDVHKDFLRKVKGIQ
jgi:site-specific recombinase XerD